MTLMITITTMNEFEKTIKEYLDGVSVRDEAFAEKYKAADKSIKECCEYIIAWVKAQKREGFTDAEIYGQAMHYYDEKDIKMGEGATARVVVNHAVELSAKDRNEAEAAAKARYEKEQLKAARRKKAARQPQPQNLMQDMFAGML